MIGQTSVSQTSIIKRVDPKFTIGILIPGVLGLLVAAFVAVLIHLINSAWSDQSEQAMLVVGGLFAVLLALPIAIYLLWKRRLAVPEQLALIALASVSVLLVAVYFYHISFFVLFPADILIWSESDFVNDILKFRTGYPIYTDQVNNESFIYTPGSQILTYFFAWLSGKEASIPVYRTIQVGYTLLAAIMALLCCYSLIKIDSPTWQISDSGLWGLFWLPFFFLIATNAITNPFIHNLHNDALAQLISVIAYFLLLQYISTRHKGILALMAIIPTIGFLVKQSLAVWAIFYCLHLVLFDRPRSIQRLLIFALVAFSSIGAVIAGGYLLWGEHFFYWIFSVLGKHGISPLRAFQHILDVWVYLVTGLLGGVILVRGQNFNRLLGPWLIWLVFILLQIYTSGVAWMLNHIGPGSLIAGVWLLAAIVRLWPLALRLTTGKYWLQNWLRASVVVIVVCLLFNGLGVVRIPLKPLSNDSYRYFREIEREFEGQSASKILIDMGTWVYLKDKIIMKDRVPSIGDRGFGEAGDFSGILDRLEQKRYSKILVRNLHSPDFHYDYWLWPKSSGIRQAMLENYHEIGRIAAVSGESYQYTNYFFSEISILVPNSN